MKKILLFIITFPFFIIAIVMFPAFLAFSFIMLLVAILTGLIQYLQGNYVRYKFLKILVCTTPFISLCLYFDIIWGIDLMDIIAEKIEPDWWSEKEGKK